MEADGSSMYSKEGRNSRTYLIFLRKLEGILARSSKGNLKYNMKYILLLLFTILMIFFSLIITINIVETFTIENKSTFSISHELIKLDFFLRRVISTVNSDLIVVYLLAILSIYYPYLTGQTKASYLLAIKYCDTNLKSVMNTTDYIGLFVTRFTLMRKEFVQVIQEYLGHAIKFNIGKNNDQLILFGSAVSINVTNVVFDVKTVDIMRYFYVLTEPPLNYMTTIRPITANKEPPFDMTNTGGINGLTSFINAGLAILLNAFGGNFKNIREIINGVEYKGLGQNTDSFFTLVWVMTVITIVTMLTFLLVSLLIRRKVELRMFSKLSIFRYLKQEDLKFQITLLAYLTEFIKNNRFNEQNLIRAYYSKTSKFNTNQTQDTQPSLESLGKKGETSKYRRTNQIRITKNFSPKTSLFIIWFSLITICIFSGLCAVVFLNGYKMRSIVSLEKIYIQNYRKLVPVSSNYLAFINLLVFGNFVLIDGKLAEDFYGGSEISDFTHYSLNRPFSDYLDNSDNEKLDQITTGDICLHFPESNDFEVSAKKACKDYIPAQRGFVGILMAEGDVVDSKRKSVIETQRDFLEQSRSNSVTSPNLFFYFDPNFIKTSILHESATQVYVEATFKMMDKLLNQRLKSILDWMMASRGLLYSILVVIFMVYLTVFVRVSSEDWEISNESMHSIQSHVIYTNHTINIYIRED